jgi:hypothetical protein
MEPDVMHATMKRLALHAIATIRVFEGGEQSIAASVSATLGTAWPQRHGDWTGADPWLVWRSPTERLAFASAPDRLAPLLAELRPGASKAGCAIDLSEAIAIWRLDGAALPSVLARLSDASALPAPGHATRLRWADVAVVLARISETEALLLADATLDAYLEDWWAYACDAL